MKPLDCLRCVRVVSVVLGLTLSIALPAGADAGVNEWLARLQAAGRNRTYVGTYVVTSEQGVRSARVWHVCDGTQQMERVETLTGAAQTTLRHNNLVLTHSPVSKTTVVEQRDNLLGVEALLRSSAIPERYSAKVAGIDRVAGLETQMLEIHPRDKWRYGYRVWLEKSTGLVLRMQTLDANSAVLEELVFSDMQLAAPVKMENIQRLMKAATDESAGNRVLRPGWQKISVQDMPWRLKALVPGFDVVTCYQADDAPAHDRTRQCVYSDGLSTVSVFSRHNESKPLATGQVSRVGSTRVLSTRYDFGVLTLVGEVPAATLKAMAESAERQR